MNKFQSFLRKCLLNSLVGFNKDFKGILKAESIPELEASNAYKRYLDVSILLDEGHMQARKNPFTAKLRANVRARSKSYHAINFAIKSNLNSNIEAERNAAILLNTIFLRYSPEFSRTSYSGAKGMITSFIQELQQKENADAIAVLKLENKLQQLLDDDTKCEANYLQCIAKNMEQVEHVSASSIRNSFIVEVRNIINFIDTQASEDKSGKWVELKSKVAIHNAKFEKAEAVRQANLKKKREEKKKRSM